MAGNWNDVTNRATAWPVGTGSVQGNVYTITNAQELAQFAYLVNQNNGWYSMYAGSIIRLDSDIDLSEHDWTPIGTAYNPSAPFMGTFDGNGKTISGLRIRGNFQRTGLFGSLYHSSSSLSHASVRDLRLEGVDIEVTPSYTQVFVGAVTGSTGQGFIENCVVASGTVRVGASSSATTHVGGIAGSHDGMGTIRNCVNVANVEVEGGMDAFVGGIVGAQRGSFLMNSQNIGDVTMATAASSSTHLGGIAGVLGPALGGQKGNAIKNCFNTGDVEVGTGSAEIGGLVGHVYVNDISDSYWQEETAANALGNSSWDSNGTLLSVSNAPGQVVHTTHGDVPLLEALNNWVDIQSRIKIYHNWMDDDTPYMNSGYPILAHLPINVPEIGDESLEAIAITAIDVSDDDIATLTWAPKLNAVSYLVYAKGALADTNLTWKGFFVDGDPVGDKLKLEFYWGDTLHLDYRFFTMRAIMTN